MGNKRMVEQIRISISDKVKQQNHFHMEKELFCVLEGELQLTVGDQTYSMQADDIIIINENKRHEMNAANDCLYCELWIPSELLNGMGNQSRILVLCNSTLEDNDNYAELRRLIKKMLNQYMRSREAGQSYGMISTYYAIVEILQIHFSLTRQTQEHADADKYKDHEHQ